MLVKFFLSRKGSPRFPWRDEGSLSDFEKFLQQHQLNEGSLFDFEKVLQRRGAFLDLEAKYFFSKAKSFEVV